MLTTLPITGIHPLGIIEVRFGNVQLLEPPLDRDAVLLAIVHDLLDLFACHHNCYDCKGYDAKLTPLSRGFKGTLSDAYWYKQLDPCEREPV